MRIYLAKVWGIALWGFTTLVFLISSVSLVHAADSPQQDPVVAQEENNAESERELEEVIVTGSRIKRSGTEMPTPTTVLTSESIEKSGLPNFGEFLNEVPSIATGFSNTNTSFSFGNAGLTQVNLRGLGVRRTLALVNGRRQIGTPDDENFIALDLATIPPSLVERVEIVTGGASAVYGADAVAGVVNIILKEELVGTQFGIYSGISGESDSQQNNLDVSTGFNFADGRGNFLFNINYADSDGLFMRERDTSADSFYVSNPNDTGPGDGESQLIQRDHLRFIQFGIPNANFFAPIVEDPNTGQLRRTDINTAGLDPSLIDTTNLVTFNPDGSPRMFELGPSGIIDFFATDGGEGADPRATDRLYIPVERTGLYSNLKFDISDAVTFNLNARMVRTESNDTIGPVFSVGAITTINVAENPYVSDELRTLLLGDPNDPDDDVSEIFIARQHNEFGNRAADITRDFAALMLGFEGDVGNNWIWEAYYQTGSTETENVNLNDRLDARFLQALDAVDRGNGPECRDTSNNCAPINVLGPEGTISQAAVDFMILDHTSVTETKQQIASAYAAGDIGRVPAGDVKLAFGVEYRKDELEFTPSSVWENAEGFFASQFSPVNKSTDVTEGFAEVVVPLLKDKRFARMWNLEAAVRQAEYKNAGSNTSWKLATDWAPADSVRFRTTLSRAVRAPTLGELFNPGSRGAQGIDDPCDPLLIDQTENRRDNCIQLLGRPATDFDGNLQNGEYDPLTRRVTTLVFSTGNEDLRVEEGDTLTFGIVLTPTAIPDLSLTIDYWDIELADGIQRVGAQDAVNFCVDSESLNNEYCPVVTRRADGNIDEILDTFVNVARFDARGVDVEMNYRMDAGAGLIDFNFLVTHLKERQNFSPVQDPETSELVIDGNEDAGEGGLPKWRGIFNTTYTRGPLDLSLQLRYVGNSLIFGGNELEPEALAPAHVPVKWYSDLYASYDFRGGDVKLYGGINNLADEPLPDVPGGLGRGSTGLYDVIGRYFYVGLNYRL